MNSNRSVNLLLKDGSVRPDFRDALFSLAKQNGETPTAFVLRAAAEKLSARGVVLSGVFHKGDLKEIA